MLADADATDATVVVQTNTAGAYGTFSIDAAGKWSYTTTDAVNQLDAGQKFTETFTVATSDGGTAKVTIDITGTNDAPVGVADTLAATEDTAVVYTAAQLLGNDTDADGNTLSISSVTAGTGGTVVLNGDGTVTFTPTANFNGPASFSYVASDGTANTTATAVTVNVANVNDVPTVTATGAVPTLTVDETVLATNPSTSFAGIFTTNYGADGAGTTAYTLGVVAGPSGLVDTATGQAVNLSLNGSAVVEGRTAVSNELVFTVSVNGLGSVTLDQQRAVSHSSNTGPDQSTTLSAANLITLTATLTDGDGDTASATANIANALVFKDDAGSLGPFVDITVVNAANNTGNGTFTYSQGADGHGTFAITGPAIPGITYTTVQNANGALLSATTDPDGPGGNAPITVFTLQVNSNGTYAFTLVTPSAASTETVSLLGLGAGSPAAFVQTSDGKVEFSSSSGVINSSTQGFGIDNQFVANGESFDIEFHSLGQAGNQLSSDDADYVSSIILKNDNINGSLLIKVTVYNDKLGTSEEVYSNLNVTGTSTVIDPKMAEFNRVFVQGVGGSGQGVRFTSLDISRTTLPSNMNLKFDVSATDRDGDPTSTSTLNVSMGAVAAPIALDLDGGGIQYLTTSNGVQYDYGLGQGTVNTAWVGAGDGLLAQMGADGKINIVFSTAQGQTDLQGLAQTHDTNADGVFSIADAAFLSFGVWQDINQDGVFEAGEFTSLADAGIVSINLVSDGQEQIAAGGDVLIYGTTSYTRSDGTTSIAQDVGFVTTQSITKADVAAPVISIPASPETMATDASIHHALDLEGDGKINLTLLDQMITPNVEQIDIAWERHGAHDQGGWSDAAFAVERTDAPSFASENGGWTIQIDQGDGGFRTLAPTTDEVAMHQILFGERSTVKLDFVSQSGMHEEYLIESVDKITWG